MPYGVSHDERKGFEVHEASAITVEIIEINLLIFYSITLLSSVYHGDPSALTTPDRSIRVN